MFEQKGRMGRIWEDLEADYYAISKRLPFFLTLQHFHNPGLV